MNTRVPARLLVMLIVMVLSLHALGADALPAGMVRLETPFLELRMAPDNGQYQIVDRAGGVTWQSTPYRARFGEITATIDGKQRTYDLARCQIKQEGSALEALFRPAPEKPSEWVLVRIAAAGNGKVLQFSYTASDALAAGSVRLLDDALATTAKAKGCIIVPVREGLLIPADSKVAFTHSFDTYAYEGCHMAMLGIVRDGAAALLTWDDPYVQADVRSTLPKADEESDGQTLSLSMVMRRSARSCTVQFLGKGDYVTIAKAYRQVAKEKGWLVTWDQKLKENPGRAQLFGAINFKLWSTLSRQMNEGSTEEKSVRVNWTFDEVAQVAEHLKRDLKLDKVHFIIGGWIHRGYDNQHPDILPAAPECGGNEGLAQCARRVKVLDYLFCLHDNYQDIYKDSPSWDESYIMKHPDGSLTKGGHWAGGLAYLTCSQKAVELAKRPQNLAAVKELTGANSYFIDTTYAAGLQECFDPKHPLTRADDMQWKQVISDYSRQVFGIFGSECGREWAIPHADFFEGLSGVSGTYYHDANLPRKLGATIVPLFEIVYRDCIALYGKYGYDINSSAEYVLHHISIGRTLNYHSVPSHLYWKNSADAEPLGLRPAIADVKQTDRRKVAISYRWLVEKTPADDWAVFVHFTDSAGQIKFQGDYRAQEPTSQWQAGELHHGPFTVAVPDGLNGTFDIRMGLFKTQDHRRARLQGRQDREQRCMVGKLKVTQDSIEFIPPSAPSGVSGGNPALFVQADGGWAQGLHPLDRFVKNTYEILSPLNELTSQMQMMQYEFLTPDHKVRRTVFGEGAQAVTVIVNGGEQDYTATSSGGGQVLLPPYGFLIESPRFISFCARNWNGVRYDSPTLFAIRSMDGKALSDSSQVRLFHGFGDARLRLGAKEYTVAKEAIVPVQ